MTALHRTATPNPSSFYNGPGFPHLPKQPALQRMLWKYLSTSWPTVPPGGQADYTAAATAFQYPDISNTLITLTPEQLYRYLGQQRASTLYAIYSGAGGPPFTPVVTINNLDLGPNPAPLVTNAHIHANGTYSFDVTDPVLTELDVFAVYVTNPYRKNINPEALLHFDECFDPLPISGTWAPAQLGRNLLLVSSLPTGKQIGFGIRQTNRALVGVPPPSAYSGGALYFTKLVIEP